MQYLVIGSEGPGFSSMDEAADLLKNVVFPSFEILKALEAKKKIVAGGLPVGDRAFVCIMEAASNDELDQILRSLPLWGMLQWQVTPLQSFSKRLKIDKESLKQQKPVKRK
jgi:muconolactone delta-isomerase